MTIKDIKQSESKIKSKMLICSFKDIAYNKSIVCNEFNKSELTKKAINRSELISSILYDFLKKYEGSYYDLMDIKTMIEDYRSNYEGVIQNV